MTQELEVVPKAQYRAYQLIQAHEAKEDFTVYQPATFTQRWYALTIDLALMAPINIIIHLPFKRYLERLHAYGSDMRYAVLLTLLFIIPIMLYFIAPTLLWGQTLGKRIVGIRVVKSSFGSQVPLGSVLIRETVGKVLSFGIVLGPLMAIFTERRRALHDYLAKTQVISYRVR